MPPTSLGLSIRNLANGLRIVHQLGRGGRGLGLRVGERRVGEECAEGLALLGGELETACLLCWPWMGGGGLCVGCGCGRRAGIEQACTLCTLLDRFYNHSSSSVVPVGNHFIYNGMGLQLVGAVRLLTDGAGWWAFYMVALSGTLLAVYQICVAGHDIFLFPEVTFAFFMSYASLSR